MNLYRNSWIFFFSDISQIVSIVISFLSITFASIKLFYSQRLGRYSDLDPTIRMILFVALPVMLLIVGPLASVVCMAAYFKEKVIVCIIIIIALIALVLKSPCSQEILYKKTYSENAYKSCELEQSPKDWNRRMKRDREAMLITAIFTSWISPCTMWFSESKFIFVSSLTNLFGHFVGIASILIFISTAALPLNDNPPITHCFKNENYISSMFICIYFHFLHNVLKAKCRFLIIN